MKIRETSASYRIKKRPYTYQEYLKLPDDGKRHEILNGELIMTPAPNPLHQMVLAKLFTILNNYVLKTKLGILLPSPCDVVLDETHVLQPDILFISEKNRHLITEQNINGTPDLVIEIISPTTAYYDLVQKKDIYQRFGVQEYWLVDPKRHSVQVFSLKKGKLVPEQEVLQKGEVTSRVLNEFTFQIEEIFPEEFSD